MTRISIEYRGGMLGRVILNDPKSFGLTDCRNSEHEPFIGLTLKTGDVAVVAYLPPELAKEIGEALVMLFPAADSPQVDFPAAVDPVAAIERG